MVKYSSLQTKIRNFLGKCLFKLWKMTAPSLAEHYQAFGTRMFFNNEMCPKFPWKKYIRKQNPYFAKWGFHVSQLDAAYYSTISGIKADHYVTRSMAIHFIYPYLDRYEFLGAYMDKNMQKHVLEINKGNNPLGILSTEDVVYNCNGIFFDGNKEMITREEAIQILVSYGDALILKPSVETFGGRGVALVPKETTETDFLEIFKNYKSDFTLQKLVKQHPSLAAFNSTSVNTIRIVTYRNPQKKTKILYSCMRFGGKGAVVDNVCSGGGYTGINLETGKLIDRKIYSYFTMDMPMLSDDIPNEIPCWDKIKEAALYLHTKLPQFDIVGWDFSVTPDNQLTLIEYNLRPGVGLQQAVGPMFSKEDLDELMEHVSKVKYQYRTFGEVNFKDLPDHKTVHTKVGA